MTYRNGSHVELNNISGSYYKFGIHTCILISPNKEVIFALLLEVVGGATLLLLVTDNPSNILVVDCCYGEK